jgi:hypothetical protein
MANGWSDERRSKQSQLLKITRPWEKSTGPRTEAGKAASSRNPYKGAVREKLREVQRLTRELSQKIKERI